MLVFKLEQEQEWNPSRHVEKILGKVDEAFVDRLADLVSGLALQGLARNFR